jgi:DNA-binding ferritin-like protein
MFGTVNTNKEDDIQINNMLRTLLAAQQCAHVHHWKVKSFSLHMALGELYNTLTELADELAEMYMGLTGADVNLEQSDSNYFHQENPIDFVNQLQEVLKDMYIAVTPYSPLLNKYEELIGKIAAIKYKMTNLK